jgi:hypothetical protein
MTEKWMTGICKRLAFHFPVTHVPAIYSPAVLVLVY